MSQEFSARITGTGSAFPQKILTNDDLSKVLETNDQWIRERTGIGERRISEVGNPDEFNSSLGVLASKNAMEMAGKTAREIDLIIYSTCTPDTIIPSTACWLQKKIQATRAAAFDVNAACSGFVYGIAIADNFIRSGSFQTILVVGADVLSAFTDWQDRGSCILFGDGAGAAVLERVPKDFPHRILSTHLGSIGELWDLFHIEAGGSNMEVTPERYQQKLNKMKMKGKEIFKNAVKTLSDYALIALKHNQLSADELDWLIPHQANLRIIEAVAKRLNFPIEKVLVNIDRYGNTSSATVPTALDDAVRSSKILPGQYILLDVFGAGLTFGSCLLRW